MRSALTLRRQIVDKNPGNTFFRRNLARTHEIFGIAKLNRGQKDDGLKSLLESRRILQQVVVDDPVFKLAQDNLASLCSNMGSALAERGRIPEAVAAYEQSRTLYQKLLDSSPADANYKECLHLAEERLTRVDPKKER